MLSEMSLKHDFETQRKLNLSDLDFNKGLSLVSTHFKN